LHEENAVAFPDDVAVTEARQFEIWAHEEKEVAFVPAPLTVVTPLQFVTNEQLLNAMDVPVPALFLVALQFETIKQPENVADVAFVVSDTEPTQSSILIQPVNETPAPAVPVAVPVQLVRLEQLLKHVTVTAVVPLIVTFTPVNLSMLDTVSTVMPAEWENTDADPPVNGLNTIVDPGSPTTRTVPGPPASKLIYLLPVTAVTLLVHVPVFMSTRL
jgi:hypothetical protein